MTAIVGIYCTDGVVIGCDSSATFAQGQIPTIEQKTEKLEIIDDHIIMAGTGPVGLSQRLCAVLKKSWQNGEVKGTEIEVAKRICRATIEDFNHTFRTPQGFGAVVAYPIEHKPYLCEFLPNDFQPELKTKKLWYTSMGSGQQIMDSFLGLMREVFWTTGPPSVQDAMFAVTWTLEHVILINPGGINEPIYIAVLAKGKDGKTKARMLEPSEIDQHRQNVKAMKDHLREFPKKLQASSSTSEPPKA